MLDVVNKIHNPAPATCAGGAKILELSEKTEEGSPKKVDSKVEDLDDVPLEEEDDDEEDDDLEDDDLDEEDLEEDDEEEDEKVPSSVSSVEVAATTNIQSVTSSSVIPFATSSSTIASASPSKPSKGEIRDNDPCSVSGEQKCASSGKTGKWLTCNIDKWLIRDCASGLVCHDGAGGKKECFALFVI